MQNMTPTSYLERLKISRDQVELFLEQPNLNLFQAAIAVLLVEGKSLPLSDLADRVEELGFESAVGDMEHSLRKAWHGQRPIYRDDADRFGLDLDTPEMEHFLRQLRVANRHTAPLSEPSVSTTSKQPDDALPLTQEELEAALRGRSLNNLSMVRKMAAVKERSAQVAVRIEESRLKQEEEQRADEEQLGLGSGVFLAPIYLDGRPQKNRPSPSPASLPALEGDTALPCYSRRRLPRYKRADLDAGPLGIGMAGGPLEGGVEIVDLDDREAGDLLCGLGEWTVGDEALAGAHAHRGGGLARPQHGAGAQHPRLDHAVAVRGVAGAQRLALDVGQAAEARLVLVDEEQVLHFCIPCIRSAICCGETSSTWVAICHWLPKGSSTMPQRSPQNMVCTGITALAPAATAFS